MMCACGHLIEDHQEDDTSAPEGCMECSCVYFDADDEED